MKTYTIYGLLLSLTLLYCSDAFSQITFQKTFGGTKDDVANWVANTSTGYIVAGYTTTITGDRNGYLLNLDASGNVIWQRMIGGPLMDQFNVVHETAGGFIVLGETENYGAPQSKAWLLKFGLDGSVLWAKTLGDSTLTATATSLTPVSGGRFLITGTQIPNGMMAPDSWFYLADSIGNAVWSHSYESGETGNLLRCNYVDNDVIYASGSIQRVGGFARLELETGDFISATQYASDTLETLYYLQPTADSNLVLCDNTLSTGAGFEMKQWVNKITRNGQTLWSKVYDRPNGNLRGSIEDAGDGNFLLTPYDGQFTADADALLAKIDSAGNVVWSHNYGSQGPDWLWKSQLTPDHGYVSVGSTTGANGDRDVLIVKTDAEGLVEGCCIRSGDITADNYQHPDSLVTLIAFNWDTGTDWSVQTDDPQLQSASYCGNPLTEITIDIAQCPNIPVTIDSIDHFAPDHFDVTLPGVNGCDTIEHYNLMALPQANVIDTISICPGDTVTIGGQQYTQSGTVVLTFSNPGACDSLNTFIINVLPQPVLSNTISFCIGDSILIGGQVYTQSGTVMDTLPGNGACDTIVTYTLIQVLQQTRSETISFCPGDSVTIHGQVFTQSGMAIDTIPGIVACDTVVTYTLILLPQPTLSDSISFCAGDSITIHGQVYTQSGTVLDTIPGNGACDTIVTYTLTLRPQPTLSDTISFCTGDSITIHGQVYTQAGTVVDTIPGIGACDTIRTFTLTLLPLPTLSDTISFCSGDSITIHGQVYTQSGMAIDTIANSVGCDTIITYILTLLPNPMLFDTISFCNGDSITINGQVYTQSATVLDTISNSMGCDTIRMYALILRPQPTLSDTIMFCNGDSITIHGQVYTQSAVVTDTIAGIGACDTIVTYNLILSPQQTRSETINFCAGDSVTINGQVFTQSGMAIDTISGMNACDTIVTYTLTLLPQPTLSDTIMFCAGDIITINGVAYTQSGIVLDTIPGASGGCDTLATYTLIQLQHPVSFDTIYLCSGDSILIGGQVYTQPGIAVDTVAASVGCDTIVTYTILSPLPAPSTVSIQCPSDVNVTIDPGMSPAVVNYNLPTATSDCPCPGIAVTLTSGMPSGGMFATGTSQVCYSAKDSCGHSSTCCFNVVVQEQQACDVKVIGCMRYEIVSITRDASLRLTYRIRVVNNCTNKLIYTAIQLPNGVVAKAPANQSVFTSEAGRLYDVRNPNFSPFYSVRFKSTTDSISGGSSDIFKYTLPAQSNPTYIHIISRLAPLVYYEAYLNTFDCPVMLVQTQANRDDDAPEVTQDNLTLFPNPTDGTLWVDLSAWSGKSAKWRILNSQGQQMMSDKTVPGEDLMRIELSNTLASGLYFFEIVDEDGKKENRRFVLQQ